MPNMTPNQSAVANRRPAGQSDRSGNLSAIVAADQAVPAAVVELGRVMCAHHKHQRIGAVVAALCIALPCVSGCRDTTISVGNPFTYSDIASNVTFAASSVSQTNIENREGMPIPGLVIRDASLIRDAADLSNSTRQVYVIFTDFLLGNMASGSYWRSQDETRWGLDIPVMNSHETRVLVVTVDAEKQVRRVDKIGAAHAQLSVDTNDFERVWSP